MKSRVQRLTLGIVFLLAGCAGGGNETPAATVEVPIISATPTPATGGVIGGAPAWADMGLTGRLVYSLGTQGVQQVDLETGEQRVLFTVPKDGWLTAGSVSEADQRLALAYAPPPPEGSVQLGYTDVYLLPGDCAERAGGCTAADLTPVVERAEPNEAYFSPLWTTDGQTLYYAHFMPSQGTAGSSFKYTLERTRVPAGEPAGAREHVADDAFWPALSPDGSQIAYVYSDPNDYSNHLYVAGADGSNPRQLTTPEMFEAVDAPIFSDDGAQVIFSAVGEGPSSGGAAPLAWLDWLMGAQPAEAAPLAHNVPSDWWEIPAAGGTPRRLTQVYDTGLFGDLSPDGRHIAYLSASGLYVIERDGSNRQLLLPISGFGTLEWIAE
jgi:Tol biopolymer transport system component